VSSESLLVTYEIWDRIGLAMEKLKKKITDFHSLGLFMAKKHYLREKNPSVTRH
jgi:hypothetical protein